MSYLKLSEGFLREAKEALARFKQTKDETSLRQACEKGFGAFAQALMHYKGRELHHREFREVVEKLYVKTKNRDIEYAYGLAEALHASFYNGDLPYLFVEDYLKKIEEGIEAIRSL